MEKSTFDLEKKLIKNGYDLVVGVDEAGRGPLAGPVVACAAMFKNFKLNPSTDEAVILNLNLISDDKRWDLVRDSKKLSEGQREKSFDFIMENFHIGIGICDHETIDRINILEASFLAMKKAVFDLNKKISKDFKCVILVDGNKKITNFSYEQKAVVGGDKIIKSISAASIIAKVTRDRMMLKMHAKYPDYGFDKHKGYGTKIHMEALSKCGPCEIHRKSFAPVRKCSK